MLIEPTLDITQRVLQHAALGNRFAGVTRAKCQHAEPRENDDRVQARILPDAVLLGLTDIATTKSGVRGADMHRPIAAALQAAERYHTSAEIVLSAHDRLTEMLLSVGGRGVACFAVARVDAQGCCHWAHVGDTVLLHYRAQTWWRRSSLVQLNTRHRKGHGLTQCIGSRAAAGPRIEEGRLTLAPRDQVLLASDGVLHDDMRLPQIKRWLDANAATAGLRLPMELCSRLEAEARLTQPHPDDTGLLVLEREAA